MNRILGENYSAFCPTMAVLSRPRRGQRLRERRIVPLWEGYCFARLDSAGLNRLPVWREVFDVIRRDGLPYALRPDVVATLLNVHEVIQHEDVTGTPAEVIARLLKVGDVVEHRGSAFEGLRGRISRIDRENVELVVELLFGSTRVIRAKARDLEVVA